MTHALDDLKQKPANELSLVECAILAADKAGEKNLAYRAADENNGMLIELAALREIARLARLVRREYPGLLAVMWEDDHKRQLPPMREKFDAAFAALDGDAK